MWCGKRRNGWATLPPNGEVFWVYRCYLKRRFGKWPYALQKAGLSKAAGRGGTSMASGWGSASTIGNCWSWCGAGHPIGAHSPSKGLSGRVGRPGEVLSDLESGPHRGGHPLGWIPCTPSGTWSRSTARCWKTAGAGAGAGAAPLRSEVEEPLRKKTDRTLRILEKYALSDRAGAGGPITPPLFGTRPEQHQ